VGPPLEAGVGTDLGSNSPVIAELPQPRPGGGGGGRGGGGGAIVQEMIDVGLGLFTLQTVFLMTGGCVLAMVMGALPGLSGTESLLTLSVPMPPPMSSI